MAKPGRTRNQSPLRTAGEPVVAPARRLPPLLRRAWYGLNQAFRRRISHLELTPDQFTVLRNLFEAGPRGVTQTELTGLMASDPNTIASLVDRMEKAGVLRRETDASDRRARRLRLAPAGRLRYAAARKVALELQAEILSAFNDAERETFFVLLDKVAVACSAAADKE